MIEETPPYGGAPKSLSLRALVPNIVVGRVADACAVAVHVAAEVGAIADPASGAIEAVATVVGRVAYGTARS